MEANLGHSQPLIDLAFAALDHAMASVADSGGPLVPLAFFELEGERRLVRAVGDSLEAGLTMLRNQASNRTGALTAIAFDGYVTTPEGRIDAICVEASEPSGDNLNLAQRYEIKGIVRKRVVPFGNPVVLSSQS